MNCTYIFVFFSENVFFISKRNCKMKEKKTGHYSLLLNEQNVQRTQIYCALFAIDYYQHINTNIIVII